MLLNRIVSWLTGYVEILVRGPHLEKLINLLTNSGLFLWDVRRIGPDVLHAKIRAHGFLRIREYAKRSSALVRIHRRRGWPFLWRKLKRRRTFLLGCVLFLAGLVYLSSFILVIKIAGFDGQDREQLLRTLAKLGVRPGISRRELLQKRAMLEREVMLETPRAVWFGIAVRGVVADVTVVRRKLAPAPLGNYDLIAARDGVVSKVIVIRGQSAVKEGDTVAPGDLLVSGVEWQVDKDSGELRQQKVPANGIVEARVWYDLEVTEPKICWRSQAGHDKFTIYSLRIGPKLWPFWHGGKKPAAEFSWTRSRKRIFQGRNPDEVVEIIKDIWQTIRWRRQARSPEEIRAGALHEVAERQRYLAGKTGQRTETWVDEGNFLKLIVTFETTQDITIIASPRKEQ